ncbi:protein sphX [Bdellovibrio sp. qaytius]|nr:protein sphX [Bdellovibrio sp. qaytius]
MKLLSLVATLAFAVSALAAEPKLIKIDGSSTVYPITEAMAEEFQAAQKGAVKVTAAFSGTGGGFKKFCRNEIEVSGASRPITQSEVEICRAAGIKYYELPVAFDATVVVVHPSNKMTQITVEELKKMWAPEAQGKIKTWADVNPAWPKMDLKLYGAGADSGTFDYFTEAIVGKAKSSRGDYTASEDDNILVKGVSGDKGALGFVPLAYYMENKNKIKALAIVNKQGKATLPTKETVENASYNPLSRPLFIYVNAEAAKRTEVKDFVTMYLKSAAEIVPQVKYIALPKKAYETATEHFNKGKLGTVFQGHAGIGMTIEELLKKEAAL